MRKRLIAPIAGRHGWLSATVRRVSRTLEAHMNMVGVAIPGSHLGQPGFIGIALYPAEFFLYRGIDQNPLDLGLLGCCSNKGDISSTPVFTIDVFAVRGNQVDGGNLVAFLLAQHTIRHRHEPDVDVEPDLMTFMPEWKRPAARLRHVADQDSLPAGGFG